MYGAVAGGRNFRKSLNFFGGIENFTNFAIPNNNSELLKGGKYCPIV